MRRLSMAGRTAQPATGKQMQATVTGATNLVGIDGNGSIFNGRELKSLQPGDKMTIDADHPIFSRRGPNQEVLGNRKEDGNSGEKAYAWYPEHDKDTSKYHSDDWPHIRADTFTTVAGVLGTSLDKATPVQLRPRAAPTAGYQSINDFPSPREFIAHQKKYQDTLQKDHLKAGILASHRSVGFEYEFTGHSLPKAGSHISLASSEKHSELFGIRFELETDSGAVVEIGMPPFIVPNKADGKPDKAELQAIHLKMSAAMLEVRQAASGMGDVDLNTFIGLLEEKGLGDGWKVSGDPKNAETTTSIKIKEPTAQKLAGDRIYAQMNISLNGAESGQLIASARNAFAHDKNMAELSGLGTAYDELERLALTHLKEHGKGAVEGLPPHFVHLNKALANTLAIPSILHQKEMEQAGDEDLSSAVKELFSVWVKDSLPNILATTSATREELADLKNFAATHAKPAVMAELKTVLENSTTLQGAKEEEFAAWKAFGSHYKRDDSFSSASMDGFKRHSHLVTKSADFAPIREIAQRLAASMDKEDNFVKNGKIVDEGPEFKAMMDTYTADNEALYSLIADMAKAHSKEGLFDQITRTVEAEIDNMIARIGTDQVVGVPATAAFQSEEFGKPDGIGVRKDTQIRHGETEAAKLRDSVVEVRNGAAMTHFFNDAG